MLFESVTLGQKVTVVGAVLGRSDTKTFDVSSDSEKGVFALLITDLRVADLYRHVGVAALLEVNLLSEVVVLNSHSLVVPS